MPKHTVILRRYSEEDESDKYYPIDTVGSVTAANKLALKTSGELGDILIVCDTAYISDLRKYAKSVYIISKQKDVIAIKIPTDLFGLKNQEIGLMLGKVMILTLPKCLIL